MPTVKETKSLAKYCIGHGINVGCGDVAIGNSIGVDLSLECKAATVKADICDLPYASSSLDYVIASAVLEHVNVGPITALREWTRCVRLDGVIAVVVPDATYGMWAMTGDTGIPGQLVKPRREMEHLHAFTLDALILLFQFTGLEIIEAYVLDREPVRRERTLICAGRKTTLYKE